MNIVLLQYGKTNSRTINQEIDIYTKRILSYTRFDSLCISTLKNAANLKPLEQKQKEGNLILKHLEPRDYVIALDERGTERSSKEFAKHLSGLFNKHNIQRLLFIIGGPYGLDSKVYECANETMSLSKMTFSHQMIRLFFTEQLYRALTIIKGHPYHH